MSNDINENFKKLDAMMEENKRQMNELQKKREEFKQRHESQMKDLRFLLDLLQDMPKPETEDLQKDFDEINAQLDTLLS